MRDDVDEEPETCRDTLARACERVSRAREAVGSALLTRPSPPARAKTVQAESVAAG